MCADVLFTGVRGRGCLGTSPTAGLFGRLLGIDANGSENRKIGGTNIALILFVEYHTAFRQSASYLMDQQPDLEVVSQAGSVAEGRERMAEGGIDAAIVDIPLPDEGAQEMVRDLHEANPSVPVLVMTTIQDTKVHDKFLRAGASEMLSKDVPFSEVLVAVRRLRSEASRPYSFGAAGRPAPRGGCPGC
jgi:DNA-binding response OmpR family regulator